PSGAAPRAAGSSTSNGPTPKNASRSVRTGCSAPAATTATTRATPRTSRAANASPAASSIPSTGRRTSTTPARRSS
ncbi:putative monooxygenase, partial [Mycobacterium sp. PO2]